MYDYIRSSMSRRAPDLPSAAGTPAAAWWNPPPPPQLPSVSPPEEKAPTSDSASEKRRMVLFQELVARSRARWGMIKTRNALNDTATDCWIYSCTYYSCMYGWVVGTVRGWVCVLVCCACCSEVYVVVPLYINRGCGGGSGSEIGDQHHLSPLLLQRTTKYLSNICQHCWV